MLRCRSVEEQALVGERVSVVDRSRDPVEVVGAAGLAEYLAVAAVERDRGGPVARGALWDGGHGNVAVDGDIDGQRGVENVAKRVLACELPPDPTDLIGDDDPI